jgi:hypothetical protein
MRVGPPAAVSWLKPASETIFDWTSVSPYHGRQEWVRQNQNLALLYQMGLLQPAAKKRPKLNCYTQRH